jgi:hypothetical protein
LTERPLAHGERFVTKSPSVVKEATAEREVSSLVRISRYKMQGVAAKDRPNGKPTVAAYFRSIKLNYSTVRSWIHRKRLGTGLFDPRKKPPRTRMARLPI